HRDPDGDARGTPYAGADAALSSAFLDDAGLWLVAARGPATGRADHVGPRRAPLSRGRASHPVGAARPRGAGGRLMLWLKGVHLVAIAFWAGGLLMLPSLFVRRQRVPDQDAL